MAVKRIVAALGRLCLLAALSLLALAPAPAETVLRLNLPISPDSPVGQNIRELALQMRARTDGAVRIELEPAGRRYEEHEVIAAVGRGDVEMGAAPLNQLARDVVVAAAFLQPFLFNFDTLVEAATEHGSEIRALLDAEILDRTGTRVLWVQPYGSSVMLSRTAPATRPNAIAGLGVATPDDQVRRLMRSCGGVPFILPPAELFAEMQMGRIVATATDIMNVRERGLWRVADTITNLRFAPSLYVVVIDERAWQRLDPGHRRILGELARKAQSLMWERFAGLRAEAYAFAVGKGMRVVELADGDIEAWRACSAPLLETYFLMAGDAASRLFVAYGKLRTQPCCGEAPRKAPLARR